MNQRVFQNSFSSLLLLFHNFLYEKFLDHFYVKCTFSFSLISLFDFEKTLRFGGDVSGFEKFIRLRFSFPFSFDFVYVCSCFHVEDRLKPDSSQFFSEILMRNSTLLEKRTLH